MNNIDIADRRIKMMDNALASVQQQAENVLNALIVQTQQGEFELDTINDLAGNIQEFLYSLYNEKDGDRYLFGGAETQVQPITETGTLDTYFTTQINDWLNTTIDSDQLIDSYRDRTQLNDSIVGYSAELSSGTVRDVFVRVDDGVELDYTVLANNDAMRDIMTAVGMIKNLTGTLDEVTREADDPVSLITAPGADKTEQNDNFYSVFNDLAAMLSQALDEIDQSRFNISQVQSQISQIKGNHTIEKNLQLDVIGRVENVDINEVAVSLNALQVQLEASYRVTATISQLNLANFL
jgi:flagellin-like hook-associated protein FlgL